jgi:hypothetical protein
MASKISKEISLPHKNGLPAGQFPALQPAFGIELAGQWSNQSNQMARTQIKPIASAFSTCQTKQNRAFRPVCFFQNRAELSYNIGIDPKPERVKRLLAPALHFSLHLNIGLSREASCTNAAGKLFILDRNRRQQPLALFYSRAVFIVRPNLK